MPNESFLMSVKKITDEIPSQEALNDDNHYLKTMVDTNNQDIYLSFSSRLALFDFARFLLKASIYGERGEIEFYHLGYNDKKLVVNGIRLEEGSSRMFLSYPENDILNITDF